jgi:6-phospho-beta-glucosidase
VTSSHPPRDGAGARCDAAIAVLGGASAFFPALAEALCDRAAELGALELRLFGRDAERARIVAEFCDRRARRRGVALRFRAAEDLEEALAGVDGVVNQVRIGGFAARSFDETFPLEQGVPGDETFGPGALASALRSVPAGGALAREVERRAPRAWFLNLSNPMSVLVGAIARTTRLRVLGVCELPQRTLDEAASLLGGGLSGDYAGLNHHGFFTRLEAGGRDRLDELAAALDTRRGRREVDFLGIEGATVRELGALPLRYVRLLFFREREVAAARARPLDRGAELDGVARQLFAGYARSDGAALPAALSRREMPWHALAVAPAIVALVGGPPATLYVSEKNRGALPFLPDDAIVEHRRAVARDDAAPTGATRAHGGGVGTVPPRVRQLLERFAEFERLALAAGLEGDADAARAALRVHPLDLTEAAVRALLPRVLSVRAASASEDSP